MRHSDKINSKSNMHRKILIGGAGFIGKHLAELHILSGKEVHVVGRSKDAPKELPSECRYVTGNYGSINTLKEILTPGCEVIDLA